MSIEAVQTALYQTLSAALSVPVYDDPEGGACPYVTIDAVEAREQDFLVDRLTRHLAYLTVWSTYAGKREVLQIAAAIHAALHREVLTLDAGEFVAMRIVDQRVIRDIDELTYMGNLTVELLVTP